MDWKLAPDDSAPRQRVRFNEILTVGDIVAVKTALIGAWDIAEDTLTDVIAWSTLVSTLKFKENDFFRKAIRQPFAAFARFQPSDGRLPRIELSAGGTVDSTLDSLQTVNPEEGLLAVISKPHWRLALPRLSNCIPGDEDKTTALQSLEQDIRTIYANRATVAVSVEKWTPAALALDACRGPLYTELQFWNSVFSSPTTLQRWFRAYSVSDISSIDIGESAESASASSQRLEEYLKLAEQADTSFRVLNDSGVAQSNPSYFSLLEKTSPEFGQSIVSDLTTLRDRSWILIHLLNCDWNSAVATLERLQSSNQTEASEAARYFVTVVDALQAIGDFTNLNMFLDCCGDSIATVTGAEDLRVRVDKVARLLETVKRANSRRVGFVNPRDLAFLVGLGIQTPGVAMQRWRYQVLKFSLITTAALLLVGSSLLGLYEARHYGKAQFRLAFEPGTTAETFDILFLPTTSGTDSASLQTTGQERQGVPDQPGASPIGPSVPNQNGIGANTAGFGTDDVMRQALHAALADIDRESDKIETDYDDKISALQKQIRGLDESLDKEKGDQEDALQDQLTRDRQDRSAEMIAAIQKAFASLSEEFQAINSTVVQYAQQQIPLQQQAVVGNPLYHNYYPGWRIIAHVGTQEAFTGLNLFDALPELATGSGWTVDYVNQAVKYAQEQADRIDGLSVVFSASGVNVAPQYTAEVPLRRISSLSPELGALKSYIASMVQGQSKLVGTDDEWREEFTARKQALEKTLADERAAKEGDLHKRLASLQDEEQKALSPLQIRRDALTAHGPQNAEQNAIEAKVRLALFDEIWKQDKITKAVLAGSARKVDFGMQAEGDYQILVKAHETGSIQIYRTDWRLPSISTSFWSFLFPHSVTVFRDAEVEVADGAPPGL